VFVLGSIRLGWATPTEAAVVAAFYAGVVGMFIYRELKPRQLSSVVLAAAKMTSVVMFLVAAAGISSWLITQANIPGELGVLLEPLLGIACPNIIYPYLRANIADTITRAGFPPIHLTEINFEVFYHQRKQAMAQAATQQVQ
jgi:preprotein translocase subunit SecB